MKKHYKISRRRWLNWSKVDNTGYSDSYLYREKDKLMCCLGQICQQTGVPIAYLIDKGYPFEIKGSAPQRSNVPKVLLDKYHIDEIVDLNDTPLKKGETVARREEKLIQAFTALGITVTFVS